MKSITERFWEMERLFRGPDWRLQLAQQAAEHPRALRWLDTQIVRAVKFLQLCRRGETGARQAARQFPDIERAQRLRNNPRLWAQIMVLALAGRTRTEIAARLEVEVDALITAEELFFDVRPMLSSMDWIHATVIPAETDRGNIALAARQRLALFGGPYVAKELLGAMVRMRPGQAEQSLDAGPLAFVKFEQAMAHPQNKELWVDFKKAWRKACQQERRWKLERETFNRRRQRCAECSEPRRTPPHGGKPAS